MPSPRRNETENRLVPAARPCRGGQITTPTKGIINHTAVQQPKTPSQGPPLVYHERKKKKRLQTSQGWARLGRETVPRTRWCAVYQQRRRSLPAGSAVTTGGGTFGRPLFLARELLPMRIKSRTAIENYVSTAVSCTCRGLLLISGPIYFGRRVDR